MYKNPTKPTIKRDQISPDNTCESSSDQNAVLEGTVAVNNFAVSGDFQELDDQINSMMSKGENLIPNGKKMSKATICSFCGKEGKLSNIRDHIEANHLEGVSIPCNFCDRRFRSRHGMRQHIDKHHK